MFQVLAPVFIAPTAEAKKALGVQLRPAAVAAWQEICRRGKGLEMAHLQIVHTGVTLAIASRLRSDGVIVIELGLGDPRQAARVIPAVVLRHAEMRAEARRGSAARRS